VAPTLTSLRVEPVEAEEDSVEVEGALARDEVAGRDV
jgi:hypothetical protein